jgi:hypothetical protein
LPEEEFKTSRTKVNAVHVGPSQQQVPLKATTLLSTTPLYLISQNNNWLTVQEKKNGTTNITKDVKVDGWMPLSCILKKILNRMKPTIPTKLEIKIAHMCKIRLINLPSKREDTKMLKKTVHQP